MRDKEWKRRTRGKKQVNEIFIIFKVHVGGAEFLQNFSCF